MGQRPRSPNPQLRVHSSRSTTALTGLHPPQDWGDTRGATASDWRLNGKDPPLRLRSGTQGVTPRVETPLGTQVTNHTKSHTFSHKSHIFKAQQL